MNESNDNRPLAPRVEANFTDYDVTVDGHPLECVRLTNRRGIEISLLNLGASIHRIKTPDRYGKFDDITLYCGDPGGYLSQGAFLGATAGRYANRISQARFSLDGKLYRLTANEGVHQLHGGPVGFDKRIWTTEYGVIDHICYARFGLVSAAFDQGFPGELSATVEYRLSDDDRLEIDILAKTTAATHVNITNHAYFNLSGDLFSSIADHQVEIPAQLVCEIDKDCIPTGNLAKLTGSALNLQSSTELSVLLEELPPDLRDTGGFDHNYVFSDDKNLGKRATLYHRGSGRKLSVFSTHPGLQFYTGNHLADSNVFGPDGRQYENYHGLCMEAQHFPDSPNHPQFPSTRLDPNETYHQVIVYQFCEG